jgi:FKBP-type peptidyl-prolyl cis-trans isomerase
MKLASVGFCAGAIGLFALTAHTGVGQQQGTTLSSASGSNETTLAPDDVASPPGDLVKTPSGLATKLLGSGTGNLHPGDDDCVTIAFRAWRRDGTLFSSSGSGNEGATQCLRPAMPGIAEALKMMVVGEKRRVWVPADLTAPLIAHHAEKHLVTDSDALLVDLTFDLQLLRIFQAPATPPDLSPPRRGAIRLPSGTFMQILKPGTGTRHPLATSWMTVDYTGWTSKGVLFESTALSSQPRLVLLGMALPGWQDALLAMVVGEKVRLWVPAKLAYGDHPASKAFPAGDLIYELNLLAFN